MSGPFSVDLPAAGGPYRFDMDHSIVDVANVPAQVMIDLSPRINLINFQRPHEFADLFEGVVDGIPIDVRMLRVEIRVGEVTAPAVPEPASGVLVVLAAAWVAKWTRVARR